MLSAKTPAEPPGVIKSLQSKVESHKPGCEAVPLEARLGIWP